MMKNICSLLRSSYKTSKILCKTAEYQLASTQPIRFLGSSSAQLFFSKEVTPIKDEDRLLSTLRSASQVDHVLQAVDQHHEVMGPRHVINALHSLFNLQKNECSSFHKEDISKTLQFQQLCKLLLTFSRRLSLQELLSSLKVLSYFEIPSTSAMMQTILTLIKPQVNDLDHQQILFLNFMLEKLQPTPLVEALLLALPMVLDTQLQLKLDRTNITQVAHLLAYAVDNRASDSSVEELMRSILEYKGPLRGRDAHRVLVAACSLHPRQVGNLSEELVQRAQEGMVASMDEFRFEDINFAQSKVAYRTQRYPCYYNEGFYDACATFAIKNNLGMQETFRMLKGLSRVGHISIPLLEYTAQILERDPDALKNCSHFAMFTVAAAWGNANYKPDNWDLIKNSFMRSCSRVSETKEKISFSYWITLALHLAVLDCYNDDVLHHIFDPVLLEDHFSTERGVLAYIQLLAVYQAVRLLHPDYQGPLPPEKVIKRAQEINGSNVQGFPLKAALEKGFGGEMYVHTQAYSKLGHFIDHAVTVRMGGYPVAFNQETNVGNSDRSYIEDFKIPSDSQMVLVLAIPPGSVASNCQRVKGSVTLQERTLEAMGLSAAVVPIVVDHWKQLEDREKIPFLMQAIRLKTNVLSKDSNCR